MTNLIKLNEIRIHNTLSILRALIRGGTLSRVELAQASDCDNTTVTRAVRDLQERGLVVPAGKTELRHGRPREQLKVNPDGARLIGISLEPYGIRGVLTDLTGKPLSQDRQFFGEHRTLKEYIDALDGIFSRLRKEAEPRLAGVGISTFGTTLTQDGGTLNKTANFPELQGFKLREHFAKKFSSHPYCADMMLCRMYYELDRHPECQQGNTMLIHLGDGIGLCLACNGEIMFSRNQHGGEFGHNICEMDGLQCACGRRGCLETRCSSHAILQEARRAMHRADLSFGDFVQKYISGNNAAVKVVQNILRYLCIALANQINNISPDTVIFVGEQCSLGAEFFKALEKGTRELLFEYTGRSVKFVFREPEECGAQSAAMLAADRLLADTDAFNAFCPRQTTH